MSSFVFVNRPQAKDGLRGQLLERLREFAVTIHAEPGGVHDSVHMIDDKDGPPDGDSGVLVSHGFRGARSLDAREHPPAHVAARNI